jgi:hypothetical protein
MTNLVAEYGVEIMASDGPTGEFREALEIAVEDYGGNELWRGEPGKQPSCRIPTKLRAVRTGERIAQADVLCDY